MAEPAGPTASRGWREVLRGRRGRGRRRARRGGPDRLPADRGPGGRSSTAPLLIVVLIVGTGWLLWRISRRRPGTARDRAGGRRRRRGRTRWSADGPIAALTPRRGTWSSSVAGSSGPAPCWMPCRAGMRAALIEQDDIAAGTSSRSSRLIHGGLRYLEQFQFPLVREALAERRRLLRIAPHLVTLEPLLFPIYGIPFLTKAFYDAGLTLYDVLGARHDGGWHRRLCRRDTLGIAPTLRTDGLRGGLLYHDGDGGRRPLHAGRRSAPPWPPAAVAVTRVRATGLRHDGTFGLHRGARGPGPDVRADLEIPTRTVVDATGVWAAEPDHPFARPVDADPAEPRRPPRRAPRADPGDGRHDHPRAGQDRLPRAVAGPLAHRHDRRAVRRPTRPPTAAGWEVDRLLATVNETIDVDLTRDDVVGTYAGLRPLIAPSGGSTVKASREHRVTVESNGVVRIGGGKYTTYRVMARDVIDAALGPEPGARDRATTAERRLVGAADGSSWRIAGEPVAIAAVAAVDPEAAARLVARHGTEAPAVVALGGGARPAPAARPGPSFLEAEVAWAVRQELALSLDDVLSRRTPPGPELPDRGAAVAPRVAAIIGAELGWDARASEPGVRGVPRDGAREYSVPARSEPRPPAGRRRTSSSTRASVIGRHLRGIIGHGSGDLQRVVFDASTRTASRSPSRRSSRSSSSLVARRLGWFAAAAAIPAYRRLLAVGPGSCCPIDLVPRARRSSSGPRSSSRSPVGAVASDRRRRPRSRPSASPRRRRRRRASDADPSRPVRPTTVASGEFRGTDDFHFGSGTASIIEIEPGRYHLRLEDFSVRNGPDLYVYLSPAADG